VTGSVSFGSKTFAVRCEPYQKPTSLVGSNSLVAYVTQRVRINGHERIWDSISIYCEEEAGGVLAVRVLVSNPDWGELLQIACLRSQPDDEENLTPLGCDLNHISYRAGR